MRLKTKLLLILLYETTDRTYRYTQHTSNTAHINQRKERREMEKEITFFGVCCLLDRAKPAVYVIIFTET